MPAANNAIGNRSEMVIIRDGGREFRTRMRLDPKGSAGALYVATGPDGEKLVLAGDWATAESARARADEVGRAKYGVDKYRIELVSPTSAATELFNLHLPGSIGVQCGVLKAGFLTLAALGAERYGIDLRSPVFDAARQTIKVVNGAAATFGGLVQVPVLPRSPFGVCLGLHQELLPQLLNLRRLTDFAHTDFEHFFVLSGNAATQILELFVVLFSAHAFAFRLTNDWTPCDITLLAVNGILKNSGYAECERISAAHGSYGARKRHGPACFGCRVARASHGVRAASFWPRSEQTPRWHQTLRHVG